METHCACAGFMTLVFFIAMEMKQLWWYNFAKREPENLTTNMEKKKRMNLTTKANNPDTWHFSKVNKIEDI